VKKTSYNFLFFEFCDSLITTHLWLHFWQFIFLYVMLNSIAVMVLQCLLSSFCLFTHVDCKICFVKVWYNVAASCCTVMLITGFIPCLRNPSNAWNSRPLKILENRSNPWNTCTVLELPSVILGILALLLFLKPDILCRNFGPYIWNRFMTSIRQLFIVTISMGTSLFF